MFEIKKGIPISRRTGGHGEQVYPFPQMEVGDCFDAPDDMGKNGLRSRRMNSIASSGYNYAKRFNPTAKFSVRTIDGSIVRCWRVA